MVHKQTFEIRRKTFLVTPPSPPPSQKKLAYSGITANENRLSELYFWAVPSGYFAQISQIQASILNRSLLPDRLMLTCPVDHKGSKFSAHFIIRPTRYLLLMQFRFSHYPLNLRKMRMTTLYRSAFCWHPQFTDLFPTTNWLGGLLNWSVDTKEAGLDHNAIKTRPRRPRLIKTSL